MWFKVDDGFHSSRKLLAVPKRQRLAAAGLWVTAGSWCGQNLTDGRIPGYIIKEWSPPPSVLAALIDARLWVVDGEGYRFKNWEEFQPSKAEVEADRARNRERQRQYRERQRNPDNGSKPE